MDSRTAMGFGGRLYGAFPGRTISDAAIVLAAEEFVSWPDDVVKLAVDDLQDQYDPPSLAQVREALRHAKGQIGRATHRAIGSEGEWTPEDEQRSREVLGTVMADWRKRQATVNRELGAAAKFDREAVAFSTKAEQQRRAPSPRCDGSGQTAEWDGTRWVCPGCGEPTIQNSAPSAHPAGGDR